MVTRMRELMKFSSLLPLLSACATEGWDGATAEWRRPMDAKRNRHGTNAVDWRESGRGATQRANAMTHHVGDVTWRSATGCACGRVDEPTCKRASGLQREFGRACVWWPLRHVFAHLDATQHARRALPACPSPVCRVRPPRWIDATCGHRPPGRRYPLTSPPRCGSRSSPATWPPLVMLRRRPAAPRSSMAPPPPPPSAGS
jgi:hypothetical protein